MARRVCGVDRALPDEECCYMTREAANKFWMRLAAKRARMMLHNSFTSCRWFAYWNISQTATTPSPCVALLILLPPSPAYTAWVRARCFSISA